MRTRQEIIRDIKKKKEDEAGVTKIRENYSYEGKYNKILNEYKNFENQVNSKYKNYEGNKYVSSYADDYSYIKDASSNAIANISSLKKALESDNYYDKGKVQKLIAGLDEITGAYSSVSDNFKNINDYYSQFADENEFEVYTMDPEEAKKEIDLLKESINNYEQTPTGWIVKTLKDENAGTLNLHGSAEVFGNSLSGEDKALYNKYLSEKDRLTQLTENYNTRNYYDKTVKAYSNIDLSTKEAIKAEMEKTNDSDVKNWLKYKYDNVLSLSDIENEINNASSNEERLHYIDLYNNKNRQIKIDKLKSSKLGNEDISVYDAVKEIENLQNEASSDEIDKRISYIKEQVEALGIDYDTAKLYVTGEGTISVSNFLDWLGNTANLGAALAGKGLYSTLDLIWGKPLQSLGWNDNPISKVAKYYNDSYDNYSYTVAQKAEKLGGNDTTGWDNAGKLVSGSVAALPDVIIAIMSGGTSLGGTASASLATKAAYATSDILGKAGITVQSMAKNPFYWTSFVREYGMDYEEAKENGASDLSALFSSTISALINAGIEIGSDGMSGIQGLPNELLNGDKSAIRAWVESALDEGKEEVLQGIVNNLTAKIVYDTDKPLVSYGTGEGVIDPVSLGEEFAMGAGVGAILGGGQGLGTNIVYGTQKARNNARIEEYGNKILEKGKAEAIINYAKNNLDTKSIAEVFNNIKNVESISAKEIGNLAVAVQKKINSEFEGAATYDEITKIADNLYSEYGEDSAVGELVSNAAVSRIFKEYENIRETENNDDNLEAAESGDVRAVSEFIYSENVSDAEILNIINNPKTKAVFEKVTNTKLSGTEAAQIKSVKKTLSEFEVSTPTQNYDVGVSFKNEKGKNVTIKRVEQIKNGIIKLDTTDGIIYSNDISDSNLSDALMYISDNDFDADAANIFLKNMTGEKSYASSFGLFYESAKTDAVDIDALIKNYPSAVKDVGGIEVAKAAFEAGRNYYNNENHTKTEVKSVKRKAEGIYINNVNEKKTAEARTRDILYKHVAKKLGIDIKRVQSLPGNAYGEFIPELMKIVLSSESKNEAGSLFHELFEAGEAFNLKDAKEVKSALVRWWIETHGAERYAERVTAYRNGYRKEGQYISYADASSEFVNDAIYGLFSTKEGAQSFATWLEEDNFYTVYQKYSVIDKIHHIIDTILENIKKFLHGGELNYAQKSVAKMEEKTAEEIREKFYKMLDGVKENLNKVEVVNNAQNSSDTRYSIEIAEDGKPVVVINTDQGLFIGLNENEYAKTAKDYINTYFKGKTLPLSEYNVVKMDNTNKYVYSGKEYDEKMYKAKMKASTELDNLLSVAEYDHHSDDRKSHSFASNGFDYYKTIFIVDGQVFEGLFDIGLSDNSAIFYGMTNIKRITNGLDKYISLIADAHSSINVRDNPSVDSSIAQKNAAVNSQYMQNSEKDTRYQIDMSFSDQVDAVLDGTFNKDNSHVYVGETPSSLTNLGIKNLPMLITANHIYSMSVSEEQAKKDGKYRKKTHYHNLGNIVKQIPEAIKSPAMIIKSNSDNSNADLVLVTTLHDNNNRPVMAAIKVNGKGLYNGILIDTNLVASAYGRNNFNEYLQRAVDENRILDFNEKRSQELLNVPRVQFPNGIQSLDFKDSISHYRDIVNSQYMQNSEKDTRYQVDIDSDEQINYNKEKGVNKNDGQVRGTDTGRRTQKDIHNRKNDIDLSQSKYYRRRSVEESERSNSGNRGRVTKRTEQDGKTRLTYKDEKITDIYVFDEVKYSDYSRNSKTALKLFEAANIDCYVFDAKHMVDVTEYGKTNNEACNGVTIGDGQVVLISNNLINTNGRGIFAHEMLHVGLRNGNNKTIADFESFYNTVLKNTIPNSREYKKVIKFLSGCYDISDTETFAEEYVALVSEVIGKNENWDYISKMLKNPEEVRVAWAEAFKNYLPENNTDTRYQIDIPDYVDPEEAKSAIKQNEKYKELIDYLRTETKRTYGKIVKPNYTKYVAAVIKEEYKSSLSKAEIVRMIDNLYDDMSKEKKGSGFARQKIIAEDIARKVIESSADNGELTDFSKTVLRDIKKLNVKLDNAMKAETAYTYGSYNEFRKRNFGNFTVSENGVNIEAAWGELAEKYPSVFDSDANPVEMPLKLVEIIDMLNDTYNDDSGLSIDDAVEYLSSDIIQKYIDAPRRETFADKKNFQYRNTLKTVKEELSRDYQKKLSEVKKEAKRREDWALAKQKAKYQDRILRNSNNRKTAEARKKAKQSITKIVNKLTKYMNRPTNKEHIPEVLRKPIAKFLTQINMFSESALSDKGQTLADKKWIDGLDGVRAALQEAKSDENGIFIDLPDMFTEEIQNYVKRMKEYLNSDEKFVVNRMTVKDLEGLEYVLSIVDKAVSEINTLYTNARAENVLELGRETTGYLDKLVKYTKSSIEAVATGKDYMNWSNLTPVYTFKRFGEAGESIFKALRTGWSKFAFHAKELIDFTAKTYTSKEVKKWSSNVRTFEISSGDIMMTDAQIMGLYCLNKRDQAKDHLLGGGMKVGEFKKDGKIISQEGVTLTEEDIIKITSVLSERQIEVADALQEFMNTVCSEWGNEVSMIRFGYRAFVELRYYPIEMVATDKSSTPTSVGNDLYRLLNMSATKSLTPGANNRIMVYDIFDVFSSHVTDMAKYNALALPVLDAIKWTNYKETIYKDDGTFDTKTVKGSLKNAYGTAAYDYIEKLIKDISGVHEGGARDVEGVAKKWLSNFKVAKVAANLRVALLQPMSYIRAGYILSPKSLIYGAVNTIPFLNNRRLKAAIDRAQKYSGIAVWKSLGFYDTNINRSLRSIIKNENVVKDKINDVALKAAEHGDTVTWGRLWLACEREVHLENKSLNTQSEEFYKAVADKFEEVICTTQVVDSTITRSQTMRGDTFYAKSVSSFMAEPTLSCNMVTEGFREYNRAKQLGISTEKAKKNVMRGALTYFIASAAQALVESVLDWWRDDDKDEEFYSIYFNNLMQNLSIIQKIPIAKDIESILLSAFDIGYGDIQRNELSAVSEFADLASWLIKQAQGKDISITPYGMVYKAFTLASDLSGVPLSSATREVVAMYNNVMTLSGNKDKILNTYDDYSLSKQYRKAMKMEAGSAEQNKYFKESISEYKERLYQKYWKKGYTEANAKKKAEENYKSNAKRSLTTILKEEYVKADTKRRLEIQAIMRASGLYNDIGKTCKEWVEAYEAEEALKR